jgi:hypothetical protein
MLLGIPTVDSSAPSPDPSQEKRREGEVCTQGPLPVTSSLHDADHLGGARADPQHPAAEPTLAQHTPEAAVTGASSKRIQDPRAGELLVALFLDAPAYKKPLRSNEEKHLTPSYVPDIAAPSLSLWFVDTCNAGEVLDERSAAAFDHLGASRRWESVEETYRSRSRTSPTSSASSTPLPRRRTFFTATQVSPSRVEDDDDCAPLDRDPTLAYRFGFVK